MIYISETITLDAYEIFRAREIVGIVKDDPKVLDSYESFLVALRGPR